ncbi:MAG: PAAR domain-containing protein [Acidobacteria bacterium]|nr:PAAR domain-containing protein [Acidobacteriota bacterium]
MAVGNELLNNFPSDLSDLAGSVENLAGRFLPPELQAAWGAIQQAGGIQGLLADVFDEPKSPQSPPGPWAARLTDIAACPGGAGPIAAPCLPTVLIGGFPAARRSDVVICNGLPIDSIAIGEPTVLMGGLFAARRDDQTAHQGKIETGFPTVHIGKKRSQAGIQKAIQCAAEAADAGAATISGSGITGPLTDGAFGGLGDIFKDAAAGALGDFAKEKIGGLVSDKVGEAISNVFEDSEKPKVKPQPKLVDDEFGTTKRN